MAPKNPTQATLKYGGDVATAEFVDDAGKSLGVVKSVRSSVDPSGAIEKLRVVISLGEEKPKPEDPEAEIVAKEGK